MKSGGQANKKGRTLKFLKRIYIKDIFSDIKDINMYI